MKKKKSKKQIELIEVKLQLEGDPAVLKRMARQRYYLEHPEQAQMARERADRWYWQNKEKHRAHARASYYRRRRGVQRPKRSLFD